MSSDVVGVGSVGEVQTVQWVFFVGPCMVRYFVGNIVFFSAWLRQILRVQKGDVRGWKGDVWGWGGMQPVIIFMVSFSDTSSFLVWELRLQYWSGILCAAVNNCKGFCSEDFSIFTPS